MNKLEKAQSEVNAIFSERMALTKKGRGGLCSIKLSYLEKKHSQQTALHLRGSRLKEKNKRYNTQSLERYARLIASNDLNKIAEEAKLLMQVPQAFLFSVTGCIWELTARTVLLVDGIFLGQDTNIDMKLDFLFDVFPDAEYLHFKPTGKTEGAYSEFELLIEENGETTKSN